MKFIFILVFSLGFLGFSVAQSKTLAILYDKKTDYSIDQISLFGSDSLDIELRIEYKEGGDTTEYNSFHQGLYLVGNNIYLLEKFVQKYYEWLDLAIQKDVSFRRDMYSKTFIDSNIRAYSISFDDDILNPRDKVDCIFDSVKLRANFRFDSINDHSLTIIAQCESGIVRMSFSKSRMLELKNLFDSDKFKNEVNKIYQYKNILDEFEPIEED